MWPVVVLILIILLCMRVENFGRIVRRSGDAKHGYVVRQFGNQVYRFRKPVRYIPPRNNTNYYVNPFYNFNHMHHEIYQLEPSGLPLTSYEHNLDDSKPYLGYHPFHVQWNKGLMMTPPPYM